MENGLSLQFINSMGFFLWLATLEQDHNHNRDGLVTDTKLLAYIHMVIL